MLPVKFVFYLFTCLYFHFSSFSFPSVLLWYPPISSLLFFPTAFYPLSYPFVAIKLYSPMSIFSYILFSPFLYSTLHIFMFILYPRLHLYFYQYWSDPFLWCPLISFPFFPCYLLYISLLFFYHSLCLF